jgi:VWFA-related protein
VKRLTLIAVMVSLLPLAGFAQAPSGEASKLSETIDVRVINVDVVVTDRKGNPITGLKRDDFEIYENGQKKPISNFYEVVGGKPLTEEQESGAAPATPEPAPARPAAIPENQKRRIIFYIDNLSLAPFNRNRVFKQMKDFVRDVMRPGDEAMVATWNRSMKVRVPFTRDPVQVQQILDVIAGESALGTNNLSERKSAEGQIDQAQSYGEALATARSYAESVMHDLRTSVSSLSALMSTVAGVEGKKILVLTSEGFPMQPGREMFTYLDEKSREKNWSQGSSAVIEGMGYNSAQLIRSIAQTANANNITLYTIHAAGLQGGMENSAENRGPTPSSVSQAALSNSTESMQMLAELTGGLASIQTNNFAGAFKKIERDLGAYYSLGYRAGTERVDRQRSLQVRVKNKNYIVRSRQSFVEKSTYAEMNDRVIANLLYRVRNNDLRILVKTETPRAADNDLYRVPIDIQIPLDFLTLLPQGDDTLAGGFDVYVVVGNKDGDMSDVARRTHDIRIPASERDKIKGKYYTYTLDLLMERGLNTISVGVVDQVSNVTGWAREQVLAQDLR